MRVADTETQQKVARHFNRLINKAGYAELCVIDKRIERHYNNGTLSVSDYGKLSVRTMEEMARFDCLVPNEEEHRAY